MGCTVMSQEDPLKVKIKARTIIKKLIKEINPKHLARKQEQRDQRQME